MHVQSARSRHGAARLSALVRPNSTIAQSHRERQNGSDPTRTLRERRLFDVDVEVILADDAMIEPRVCR